MDHLYAPWRSPYLTGDGAPDCVFCAISQNPKDDLKNHVLFRDESCFVVMNRYPYTPGHFMIIPHAHKDSPELLGLELWLHLQKRLYEGLQLLYAFGAQGVNLGFNIKEAAGAGIAPHLHGHLVPRFHKDTNFMTTIGQTRIYGVDFKKIYTTLQKKAADYFTGV
ncbi:HIT family protein [Helicobacter ailurogastricus]|uniref:HIT family protein n=1 Tax=Helicobacter ailurogastricus TaxID=1578720 RepID=A0A0K2XYI3_9HELI|nr:HIT domain-containing protein [Helicobacter ailurogastricus]CRF52166.1 HIT family protein [Helicobacter ailurogastricus]BDQ29284.1 hydrolase [Helicobacter ailurogastricus]GLH57368.1 Histidine triad family protein [Helicobacter ailurogastricus]GLH58740.1 Histidine triad family protein [Helicobacter ailurogastricus]GMB89812.1 Histidine triad family protein [Helicobacter ailurogastricus]